MSELKQCPFCGGRADWWETESDTHRFQIVCVECFCGTDECISEEVALKRWNTREPIDLIKKEISELANVDGNAYLDCADVLEIIKKVEGGT